MQVAGAFVSYDICDVEHYYNTSHRNYTIAELISLHILSQTVLLTLLKLFWLFFMFKNGYRSSDKQLEIVSQWKGLKFVYVPLNDHAHKSEVTHP